MNSGAGGGFALFFLAVIVFSIVRSKKKLKTVLYTLVAMAIAFAAGLLAGLAFKDYAGAIGTLAGAILVPFAGMICALEHSRKSRVSSFESQEGSKKEEPALLTREQMKQFEADIKEPYKEHESEKRRSIGIRAGFFEKLSALSAGLIAVCASIILAISGKYDIHSDSIRVVVHELILIADFLGASFILSILHGYLSAQVTKLDVAISASQFQWILFTKISSLDQKTSPSTNNETIAQAEDAVREQMSPKKSKQVKYRDHLYLCLDWLDYLSILVFGIAIALILFYLHKLW